MQKLKFFNSIGFIRALFLMALFVLIFLASITYRHIKELGSLSDSMMNTYEISIELEKLMSYLKDAENEDRGYVITSDTIFLEPFENALRNINYSFEILKNTTANNIEQQKSLQRIHGLVDNRFAFFKEEFYTRKEFHDNFIGGKKVMDSLRTEIKQMLALENKTFQNHNELYKYNNSNTPLIVFSTFLISILILVLGYFRIIKNYKSLVTQNIELKIFDESSRQAEILGKYGSWLLNLSDETFTYSDNKFRLLGTIPQSFDPTFQNLLEFIHPNDVGILKDAFENIKEKETLPMISYRIIRKDNNSISYFRTTGKIFIDSLGNRNMIGTTQDITEDFNKKQLIRERNKELEQNNKELMEFNHVASHDLQEPLRKIQTFISRIDAKEGENLSDSGRIYFKKIQSAASRMRVLIDDLLQYSRTNKSEQKYDIIDLNIVAQNAISELSENINDKKAKITFENLHELNGLQFQLEQLFINLIGNSLKYSKPNEAPIITITSKKIKANKVPGLNDSSKNNYIKIIFKDNGLGFEQEYAEKIFLLFNRLHGKTEYQGTGVGLAICKKIIENHKGFISAKSKPNNGATFTVYLPE